MTWEGGSPSHIKFKESCDHCGIDFELLDKYHIDDDGVTKSCDRCFAEQNIVRKRNEAIDSIIDKQWYQFWK